MVHLAFVLIMIVATGKSQDSVRASTIKFGHFIFNINSGVIISNAISNIGDYGKGYSQTPSTEFCYGYSGGAELLWGLIPEVTQSFGLGYNLTNSDFIYQEYYWSGGYLGTTHKTDLHYHKQYQNWDLIYGWTFLLTKHVRLQIMGSYSHVFRQTNTRTGYTAIDNNTTYYNNTVDHFERSYSYFSFRPKLVYDFKTKAAKFAVFLNFNWGIFYNQEWSAIGLQYYPFRKLQ